MMRSYLPHKYSKRFIGSTTRIIPKENLPVTAYKPDIVEEHKYDEWERKEIFKAKINRKKSSFSVVLPPPNVTGKLHLGLLKEIII